MNSAAQPPERLHEVRVYGIPLWVDAARLLGEGQWSFAKGATNVTASGKLPRAAAARLQERLRNASLGGENTLVHVTPALSRTVVREARLEEARARRDKTPGFLLRGTRVDDEGRFSLTPEALAMDIAARVRGGSVVDACTGAGGNAIAFARAGLEVTALELSKERLALARHNARVYGVEDRIRFVAGDARELLPTLKADLLFLDPPWGEDYDRRRSTADDLPLAGELLRCAPVANFARVWLKAPPSFDPRSLEGATADMKVHALFGAGAGDFHRVKMLLVELR